jgi:cation/acetate symporter
VYGKGVDGCIYMIAFFVGWPIILFLMAGLVSAVVLVVLSKSVWGDVFGYAEAIFPYQPALFSMPVAFLLAWMVSRLDNSAEALAEREAFGDQYVRARTGFGAESAAAH